MTDGTRADPAIDEATGPAAALYRRTWGRLFPVIYDRAFHLAERSTLRAVRAEVVGQAGGRVVELGAGTGLNLGHYGPAVTRLTITEPDPGMAARLRARVAEVRPGTAVVEAGAEALPFPDGQVDTVVATLVLCTIPDPARALAEVARILRPGGTFLFAEHVRSPTPTLARWQDRLHQPWWWFGCGCHCNRDTVATISASALRDVHTNQRTLRGLGPLVSPLAVGSAVRPES